MMSQSDLAHRPTPPSTAEEALSRLDLNLDTAATISPRTYAFQSKSESVSIDETEMCEALPAIQIADRETPNAEFEISDTLGKGGTARVELAHQKSLDRDVAIKSLHADSEGQTAAVACLLHEARITGYLEHPNIVPVHALGRDSHGHLRLVMKRIEGTEWDQLLQNADHPSWPELLEEWHDHTEAHLQILMRVAAVAHFAHQRGVIHRDIKPANVMVGRFGEVYLVDWGIAEKCEVLDEIRTHWEAQKAKDPSARSYSRPPNLVVGTPAYMAPEMLLGQADARTDVYLLGATLHKILTGHGRHSGSGLMQVISNVTLSAPFDYRPEIPPVLAEIANRATHASPEQRYASALDFRRAIANYLHRQGSENVRAAGDRQREALEALEGDDEATLLQAQQLYAASSFSYQLALKEWPENTRAQTGLDAAIEAMIAREIRAGNANAVARLLSEHRDPPQRLNDDYQALQAQIEKDQHEAAEHRRLLQDIDPTIGRQTRGKWAMAFAIVALIIDVFIVGNLPDLHSVKAAFLFQLGLIALTASAALSFFCRRWIFRNTHNRQWWALLNLVIVADVTSRGVGLALEIPANLILINDMLLFSVICGTAGALMDRRLLWIALSSLLGTALSVLVPEWSLAVEAVFFTLVFFPIAYIVWTPRALVSTR